ncbi:MFS transporter [Prochlorococcus sp. MIT 1341]|uniref:MFS transporter n=1 Tax=Prochlorococcus sp. MIT 1341 TaxID=3096221 RepID=UPI002A74E0E0|nr:MFS transporter [Prochlorococcus sp. MIT 1341]
MPLTKTKANKTFFYLWLAQLISNLGTQTTLYGIGLWLFSNTQQLTDFALVAFAVQLARIIVLPLIGNQISAWPRRQVMLISNCIGALCTLGFAMVLLQSEDIPLLAPLLLLQGLAAMAEATLILSFSSLIPALIINKQSLIKANGLFASTDSVVLAIAPFLGSWLAGTIGLEGVLSLDACSFILAFICVLAAPWSTQLNNPSGLSKPWRGLHLINHWETIKELWRASPLSQIALTISTCVAFSYAATEILFPAWVAVTYGPKRMALVILAAILGYLLGLLAWQTQIGNYWKGIWQKMIYIQALILMGAGLQIFESTTLIWFAGVFIFSGGIPIVMSSIQQIWSHIALPKDLPRFFAIRYAFEWSARLIAFITVSIGVDQLIQPVLLSANLPPWIKLSLGTGEGRAIAVALGAMGWVLFLSGISQKKNLRSTFR